MLMTDVSTQKKILPIVLPSMVGAQSFSDHPRKYVHCFPDNVYQDP